MTINEYQAAALRTAQTDKLTARELLLNSALGLCGESGEVADLVKKHRFQGHDLDFDHIAKELGDISWYLAVGAYAIGYDLETILQMNVDKLKARYPDGFSVDRSLHRAENDVWGGEHGQHSYTHRTPFRRQLYRYRQRQKPRMRGHAGNA